MYQLYLNTMSPLAMKASALIGYAGLACQPQVQNLVSRFATIKRLTGDTMIPVLRRGQWAINDSTRIARYVAVRSDRRLLPADPAVAPMCWLLEEFADEWMYRWVMLSRWADHADGGTLTDEVGREMAAGLPGVSAVVGRLAARRIRKKLDRLGAIASNREALIQSRQRLLQAVETLLEESAPAGGPPFLFESYPTVADFAWYGQLSQYAEDPAGRPNLKMYPQVGGFVDRIEPMRLPCTIPELRPGRSRDLGALSALFGEFLGTYWRVLVANYRAYRQTDESTLIDVAMLDGEVFSFQPTAELVERLEFVLSLIDRAYAQRSELFGGKGLDIEHALVQQIGRLTDCRAGRELLRRHPHIGEV